MTESAFEWVQRGLYNKLKGDGTLNSMVRSIFSGKDSYTVDCPYIRIAEPSENDRSVMGKNSTANKKEYIFTLHIWSKTDSNKEVYDIHNRCLEILDKDTLDAVEGQTDEWYTIYMKCESAQVVPGAPEYTHMVARWRIKVGKR
jgi:hypothetical protein